MFRSHQGDGWPPGSLKYGNTSFKS